MTSTLATNQITFDYATIVEQLATLGANDEAYKIDPNHSVYNLQFETGSTPLLIDSIAHLVTFEDDGKLNGNLPEDFDPEEDEADFALPEVECELDGHHGYDDEGDEIECDCNTAYTTMRVPYANADEVARLIVIAQDEWNALPDRRVRYKFGTNCASAIARGKKYYEECLLENAKREYTRVLSTKVGENTLLNLVMMHNDMSDFIANADSAPWLRERCLEQIIEVETGRRVLNPEHPYKSGAAALVKATYTDATKTAINVVVASTSPHFPQVPQGERYPVLRHELTFDVTKRDVMDILKSLMIEFVTEALTAITARIEPLIKRMNAEVLGGAKFIFDGQSITLR